MPSATRDKYGWIAEFRPLGAPRKRRARKKLRVPARFISGPDERAAAQAFAAQCEQYCRLLELDPDPLTVRKALELRVISEAQASDLREGRGARPELRDEVRRLTLENAWDMHPSTQRESASAHEQYDRHLRNLRRFAQWSGVKYVDELTLPLVQDWIAHLKAEGYKFDTRRHYLMPIRRASRMAGTRGLADVMTGLALDRREDEPMKETRILPMAALVEAARRLQEAGERRMLAATALGAFMGLRPSEIQRLRVGDVDLEAATLQVGAMKAKNRASRRLLPLPRAIADWLKPLLACDPEAPLIRRQAGRGRWKDRPLERTQLSREIQAAAGVDEAKTLRKSFTTWAHRRRPRLDPELVEAWIGHKSHRITAISNRHYMADLMLEEFQPIAEAIEALLTGMAVGGDGERTHKKGPED